MKALISLSKSWNSVVHEKRKDHIHNSVFCAKPWTYFSCICSTFLWDISLATNRRFCGPLYAICGISRTSVTKIAKIRKQPLWLAPLKPIYFRKLLHDDCDVAYLHTAVSLWKDYRASKKFNCFYFRVIVLSLDRVMHRHKGLKQMFFFFGR